MFIEVKKKVKWDIKEYPINDFDPDEEIISVFEVKDIEFIVPKYNYIVLTTKGFFFMEKRGKKYHGYHKSITKDNRKRVELY